MSSEIPNLPHFVKECPLCGGPFVDFHATETTLVGFRSPNGHNHDDNCKKRPYVCAQGHITVLSIRRRCTNALCDWVGKATCWCHSNTPKVDAWPELGKREASK